MSVYFERASHSAVERPKTPEPTMRMREEDCSGGAMLSFGPVDDRSGVGILHETTVFLATA